MAIGQHGDDGTDQENQNQGNAEEKSKNNPLLSFFLESLKASNNLRQHLFQAHFIYGFKQVVNLEYREGSAFLAYEDWI